MEGRMKTKKIPEWLTMDSSRGGVAVCDRCGGEEKPQLPMSIDALIAWSRYVGELHRTCKAAA
jgi:hypothetical protein